MADIATIKVGNDNESSYKLYPVNDEFLKRADEPETAELPAVTAADNGKILSVANGVWTATSLPVWQGGSY